MIDGLRKYLTGAGLGPLLLKAVSGSAGLRIAGMGLGFLVGVQLAHGLGTDGYGVYGIAMSVIALLAVPTEFGLPQLVARDVAANATRGNWAKVRGILRWSIRTSLVSWVLVSSLVLLVLHVGKQHIEQSLASVLLVGLLTIPLVALGKTQGAALRGLRHFVKGQLPEVVLRPGIQSALLLATGVLAITLTPPLAVGLGVFSSGVAFFVALVMLRKALPMEVWEEKPEINAPEWRSSCIPMAMTEAMRILQHHLAILMIGLLATASSVGIYKVATGVSVVVATPVGILISVIGPMISSLFAARDFSRLQKLLAWSSAAMVAGVALLSLPVFFAAHTLISLVFGDDFLEAAVPLQILCAGALLTATAGNAGTLLNMTGNELLVRRASLEGLILLTLIMPPLILLAGPTGAAIATVVSSMVWRFRMARDCRRLLGLEPGLIGLFRSGDQ